MNNKKFKILFSNTIIFAIGNLLVKLISFFLMPLYTSQLTTEQYGVSELINSSIEIVLPIATLCIIDALFRFAINEDVDQKILISTSMNVLLKGFVLVLLMCTLFYSITSYEFTYYFYFLYVTTALYKLFSQFARGLGHVKRFALSGVISALALVISNVILLVFLNGGVESYLISFIISNIVAGLFSFFASKEYLYLDLKAVDMNLLKNMLLFSIPNIANMLSWWLNNVSSRYIILGFSGAGMAGLFTAASKMPSMINMLATIFQQAWQYSTAKEIKNEDSNVFFTDVFKFYYSFIMLACSGLLLITPYISKFILQGDFYEAWVFVPLLLFSATVGCISTFFGTFYTAVMKNVMGMVSTIIGAIINVVISLILVPFIGVYGALVASVISYLIITIIRIIDTRKYVRINVNYVMSILQLVVLLVQSVVVTVNQSYSLLIAVGLFISIVGMNMPLMKKVALLIVKMIRGKKSDNRG